ncbi:unnamed protein product [Haemonchus placei]|uniref:DUF1758 domain-containing protein n=1 Tax=Haemonchus placei TaxID=6290 RepID=A0A0N4WD92_HAEPC|nr:unnamed protein product [Haemonchus placei]
MGELQETFKSNEVKVTLKGLRSSRKPQRLPVFTKDKLTMTINTAPLSATDKSFIKREKIMIAQQNLRPSEVSPELLNGQDFLNQVFEHHNPVIKLPSGLVLTPTIFGYTISGTGSIPNSMKQVRDVQCGSLIVLLLLYHQKTTPKTDKNISATHFLPISESLFLLASSLHKHPCFSSKNARDTFYALLDSVNDFKRMESEKE